METTPFNNEPSLPANSQAQPLPVRKLNRRFIAVTFLVIAGIFTLAGLWRMYTYDSDTSSSKIVGGDAYNYIIIAARGTGLICCGIVSALVAVTVSIWDLIDRQT